LRIVTNGLLLDRHPELPVVMREIGNSLLRVTLHHDSRLFLCRMNPQIELLRSWIETFDISVRISPGYEQWTRRYRGFGAGMEPFEDNDPRSSWKICMGKYCMQLHDGKLWKCPPLAYLNMQNEKYGLSEKWRRYLEYTPLDPGCTEEELVEFLGREDEPHCSMCPSYPRRFQKPYPLRVDRPTRRASYAELDPLLRFALESPGSDKAERVRRFVAELRE
jgi:hypothetical protein